MRTGEWYRHSFIARWWPELGFDLPDQFAIMHYIGSLSRNRERHGTIDQIGVLAQFPVVARRPSAA